MGFEALVQFYEKSKVGYSPIVDQWFLFGNPLTIITIIISYIILVKFVGPRYMRDRKPYDLLWAIRIYNIFQIVANLYMIIRPSMEPGYFPNIYSFGCSVNKGSKLAFIEYDIYRSYWHFLANKLLDFADTMFFVLRKKQSHVTFLHVFHHCSMVFVVWYMGKYLPGPEPQVAGLINALIHVFMYTYYLFSSFGETFSFVFKLKKYLTIAQITQFLLVMAYYSLAMQFNCGFKSFVIRLLCVEAFANLLLFINFYRKTYGKKNQLEKIQKMFICSPLQSQENGYVDENMNVVKPNGDKQQKFE